MKRIKFCEWDKVDGHKCGMILTEKQYDYSKENLEKTGGFYLCYGHQGQYKFNEGSFKI